MIHYFLVPLANDFQPFNVFRYITFRTGGALMTALIIAFVIGPPLIRWLKVKQGKGQPIREDGPQRHILEKKGTPTMGGFMILIALTVSTLLWGDLTNLYVWVVMGVTLGFGLLGFADDYLKVTKRSPNGVSGRVKLVVQAVISVVAVIAIMELHRHLGGSNAPKLAGSVAVPFLKDFLIYLGPFFIVFGMLVIVGASNAVNLTDGLDGLAIVPVMVAGASFGMIAYLVGRIDFTQYLQILFVPGTGELAVLCGALLGAGLGFLWYNAPPASVFMGDTGSLALGGMLGTIAVATKHEIVLGIIGGLFVLEAVSVIVQVASFKLTGKRVFKMAPIHHHFEQLGWREPTIVIRFWIIAVILALIGLSTLKIGDALITIPFFKDQTVAVFGLARSGVSAGRALIAGGAKVIGWDDKAEARAAAEKADIATRDLAAVDWHGIAALILSPGVPLTHPAPHPFVVKAREARTEIIGDIELFFRAVRREGTGSHPKIVCVTGTNGKSTTTALIGHLLSRLGFDAEVGGNIGKPVLELAAPTARRAYVLELSSFQIDLTPSVKPDVAVLINITPDHLDRHGAMAHYASVKERIFSQQQRSDVAIIGVDDPPSAEICTRLSSRGAVSVIPVSVGKVLGRGIFVLDGRLYDATGATTREVRDLRSLDRLPGVHNWQNAAIAYAAVRSLVKDPSEIAGAMTSFPGLEHRIELVGQIGRVRFVNDSKATNADAAARALACYDNVYWIAGGKPKQGGIESLRPFFARLKKAYLIGDAADAFATTLGSTVPFAKSGTLEAATRQAAKDAESDRGDGVVLLSPACASFDQFRDFEHRGVEFKRVFKLLAEEARLRGAA